MASNITLFFQLFYNPLRAITELRARAPYFFAIAISATATLLYGALYPGDVLGLHPVRRVPGIISGSFVALSITSRVISAVGPLLFLAAIFVPAALFVASFVSRGRSFSILLRQEYAGLASCVLYAWAAAHAVLVLPLGLLFHSEVDTPLYDVTGVRLVLALAPIPYFIVLAGLGIKVVLNLSYPKALLVLSCSALSLVAIPVIPRLLFFFSSPFLAIMLFLLLRGFFRDMLSGQESRERFKQSMEASTLNPADASAHYNLGLVYLDRGQIDEAKRSFERAIEIDPEETDAQYRLGILAREQGKLSEAITYFDHAVSQDAEHGQSEVWREIGKAYFQAGQYQDAAEAFAHFLEKRPTDGEGHYRYGLTLHKLGRREEATGEMKACIEAVKTSPAFKYRAEKQWMNEAQSFLRLM